DRQDNSLINIGLAHGSLMIEGKYQKDDFPIETNFARKTGLDYLALGHWHSYFKLDDYTFYPGTIEPLEFKDSGFTLHVKIETPGAKPEVEKLKLSQFSWDQTEAKLTNDTIENFFESVRKAGGKRVIKKIDLSGFLSLENYRRLTSLLSVLEDDFFKLLIENNVYLEPDDDEIREIANKGYLRTVVNRLLALKKDDIGFPFPLEEGISGKAVVNASLLKIYEYFKG
ncbi:MAG: hypothetical protein AB1798_08080, partial [Spirochaetota bacterium]